MTNRETLLEQAHTLAKAGRFPEMQAICQEIVETWPANIDALLDVAALYQNFGYLTRAHECYELARERLPDDLRIDVNLANLARETGEHAESRRRYAELLQRLPDHAVIRRNNLVSQEYDPAASDADRLQQARAWGGWSIARAGGWRPRPPLSSLTGRCLRLGYVSADLCQHTVGLLLKDVLLAHDPAQISAFAYSAGSVNDWVTDAIREATRFRDATRLNDAELAELIRQDEIDVLIDLSGHTAGSRLSVFAHRPAPVMVSWLGYFASTGLPYIDAALLDAWHAPSGIDAAFVEQIIRLPAGRLCYQPVPWAPLDVSPAPYLNNAHLTFGCFNNTAKLNDGVFDVWSKILMAVPDARLVLKWRTLADEPFCTRLRSAFAARGIAPERVELRQASFHAEVLKEYADIDIALDPFPFTGGLTSCEALWMGVPVVTWPQSRVVSRQTFALLSAIGLPELAAKNAEDYVHIAVCLAANRDKLPAMRRSLRSRMLASSLMDVAGFARDLENTLRQLYITINEHEQEIAMNPKTILHVGPGHRNSGAKLPAAFQSAAWREIRIDIDPGNEPDILGSMLDMSAVTSGSVDALYSAHNIEHVYAHEVPVVLGEFLRVLKSDGFAVITCPDLQTVCALVAQNKLTDAAYKSQAGNITPLDILYGHGESLANGHFYMAHKCGFTEKSITEALQAAGFQTIAGKRRSRGLDLWMLASKHRMDHDAIRELATKVLPD